MQPQPHAASGAPPVHPSDHHWPLLEIRPDASAFWRGVGFRALILGPLIVLGIYRSVGRTGVGWSVPLYGGLIVVLVVGAFTMLQTSSVVLTATTIEKRRRWLPPTVVHRAAVASGVLVPQYRSAFNRTAALLVLAGANGRPLMRLTGQIFSASDLFALAEQFGHRYFDVLEGIATPKAVSARHRKLLPLVERRPGLVTVAATVLLLVAVVVGVSILSPAV